MTLKNLVKIQTIIEEETSKKEIDGLLKIIERDIKNAKVESIDDDWRFGIAYNAALKLAEIPLRVKGYRAKNKGHHMNTISTLTLTLGKSFKDDRDYLDLCRMKRNKLEYTSVNVASRQEAEELIQFVEELFIKVKNWLKTNFKEV